VIKFDVVPGPIKAAPTFSVEAPASPLPGLTIVPGTQHGKGKTTVERVREHRERKARDYAQDIAVLDMETDPFDNVTRERIYPFCAVLYSDNFEPMHFWEMDFDKFLDQLIGAIEALPRKYVIYAHNGGRFDFMFLISRLRGDVSFKGRGIMSAKVGNHELRDSFHIIPEKLASYQKDAFDYRNLTKDKREAHKEEILRYCEADCRYLLDIVKAFIKEFRLKISIGQAALAELQKEYPFECVTASMDEYLRQFFFGGRVECLQGLLHVKGHKKLYDVNSMYPAAMVEYLHPVGKEYVTRPGKPDANTCFIELSCTNHNALVCRDEEGNTTANQREGRFFTTIHEYRMALKYGLIENVVIHFCVDNQYRTNFDRFIVPLYNRRQLTKAKLKQLEKSGKTGTQEWADTKKDDIFIKLLLNNAYGKLAENPRNFKEHYFTEPGEFPPEELEGYGHLPKHECKQYWVWERPSPKAKFKNVGTAASITGAARAILMEAIHHAKEPIYCDTDSLICDELEGLDLHPTRLGAWDLEAEFSEVVICGKKMYACKPLDGGKPKVRSKGVAGLTYDEMVSIYEGKVIQKVAFGPTLDKTGRQYYQGRNVRATAKRKIGNGNNQCAGIQSRQSAGRQRGHVSQGGT